MQYLLISANDIIVITENLINILIVFILNQHGYYSTSCSNTARS